MKARGNHRGGKASRRLYGNCVVYPPDSDRAMFRCDPEREVWYLERGLAIRVSENPPIIRLTFKPNGPGHYGDSYFLQEFKNQCVVCGAEEDLSHHHTVPYAYRRHFPKESYELGRWMYDVLLLCLECHKRYEKQANELKEEIAREHGIPSSGLTNLKPGEIRIMKAAATLERHRDKIPPEKRAALEALLKDYLKKDVVSDEDYGIWRKIRESIETTPSGVIVAAALKDSSSIDDFAIRWRRHFLKHMKPRFLPEKWDPERRIYSEPDQACKA